jgi:hypothetical protein
MSQYRQEYPVLLEELADDNIIIIPSISPQPMVVTRRTQHNAWCKLVEQLSPTEFTKNVVSEEERRIPTKVSMFIIDDKKHSKFNRVGGNDGWWRLQE